MNNKIIILGLTILFGNYTAYSIGVEAVNVISDAPAKERSISEKIDAMTSLQSMIDAVATAQSLQSQIKQLQNIANFQKDPANAVNQVNSSVTNLVNTFNKSGNTSFKNLSQLISAMSSSASATGMGVKMAQAANMQLMGIQTVLEQLKAQNNALLAYKQAEQAQQQAAIDDLRAENLQSKQYQANRAW